jgi:hypothetical protein
MELTTHWKVQQSVVSLAFRFLTNGIWNRLTSGKEVKTLFCVSSFSFHFYLFVQSLFLSYFQFRLLRVKSFSSASLLPSPRPFVNLPLCILPYSYHTLICIFYHYSSPHILATVEDILRYSLTEALRYLSSVEGTGYYLFIGLCRCLNFPFVNKRLNFSSEAFCFVFILVYSSYKWFPDLQKIFTRLEYRTFLTPLFERV